jgi:hypothetical protein
VVGLNFEPQPITAVALTGGLLVLNEVPRPPELTVSWVAIFLATSAVFWTLFAAQARYWWAALPASVLAASGAAAIVAMIPDGDPRVVAEPVARYHLESGGHHV